MREPITSTRKKAKRSRYFDYIVSMSAVLISVCAFSVSYYQTQVLKKQTEIMQEQMHAGVWPRLFLSQNQSNNFLELVIKNDGVGPAIVKSVEICVDGKPYSNWNKVLSELTNIKEPFPIQKSFINNRTIRQGDQIKMFRITDKDVIRLIHKNYYKLSIEICYSSIYGKNWKLVDRREKRKGFPVPEPIEEINFVQERQFLN